MKDFDAELDQDLSFTIQGRQFNMRYVRPEVLAAWGDEPDDEKSEDILKRQDERVLQFLATDDDRKLWVEMRKDEDNALPLVKLNEVVRWMVEVQATRPTNPPSPSASGRGKTVASLKAASS